MVLLLDDVLAGLDNETEELLFSRIFGPGGLLKKLGATVILVTNLGELTRKNARSPPAIVNHDQFTDSVKRIISLFWTAQDALPSKAPTIIRCEKQRAILHTFLSRANRRKPRRPTLYLLHPT